MTEPLKPRIDFDGPLEVDQNPKFRAQQTFDENQAQNFAPATLDEAPEEEGQPDIPMAIVGSPDYFSRRSVPTSVSQLIDHQAINLYLPTSGTANRWRLIRGGREVRVRMEGQLLLNTIDLIIDAAIDGHGLAYLPYDQVERAIKEKKLIRVLDKFTPDLPGYHLYYPHRRHAGSAFSLFIDRLKYKGAV
ncbi:LysR family transcriptional regulator [Escherichia coli]|nr:LysR family transcriptional regulator [Escherichia coli]